MEKLDSKYHIQNDQKIGNRLSTFRQFVPIQIFLLGIYHTSQLFVKAIVFLICVIFIQQVLYVEWIVNGTFEHHILNHFILSKILTAIFKGTKILLLFIS